MWFGRVERRQDNDAGQKVASDASGTREVMMKAEEEERWSRPGQRGKVDKDRVTPPHVSGINV